MTLDEALAQPGRLRLVAAWDYRPADCSTLCVYSVSEQGAKLLALEPIEPSARAEMTARLKTAGVAVGATESYSRYVWILGDTAVEIWRERAHLVTGSRTDIRTSTGERIDATRVRRVFTFLAADDIGHRGVRCELEDGNVVVLVEEREDSADTDTLDADVEWTLWLAYDFAMWLSVPHVDSTGRETTHFDAKLARLCAQLAAEVESAGLEHYPLESIAEFPTIGSVRIRVRLDPSAPGAKAVDLRMSDGRMATVARGGKSEIVDFLRHHRTPRQVALLVR